MEKSKNKIIFTLLLSFTLCFVSSSLFAQPQTDVFVSILPQQFFVEKIAQKLVNVRVMVRPGMSPATYEPLPQQMAELSRSKMFFAIGVAFENSLLKKMQATFPEVKICHTDAGINKRIMQNSSGHNHDHNGSCDHQHGSKDPHIWLDPLLVKQQATNIASGLIEIFPDNKETLLQNLKSFHNELDNLHLELKEQLKPFTGKVMLVFHPAFGYFSDRYGLKQQAIEIEGKEPSPRQMAKLIRQCRKFKVKTLFVQKQFASKAAHAVANSIDGKVVSIDPLRPDYFAGLKQIADSIIEGLQNE
ncbi:MAG: metal ABC transporter solute-binding protein, Zn/Mn family [Candidatus Rifleibacteriota bacterium]